jgi:hypothetical protein
LKKLIAVVVLMLTAGAFASAALAAPGPNGSNDHGLCTAYFNGQKNGHDKKDDGSPGPFGALEDAGAAYTDSDGEDNDRDGETDEEGESASLSPEENVYNYCNDNDLIGGNPVHGRFTCEDPGAEEPEGDSDPECDDNPAPGNSG